MLALQAGADGALDVTRALEKLAASDPKQAITQGRQALAQAVASGDKRARLNALRLLTMAHGTLDDNRGLRDAATQGLALAVELDDKVAQVEFTSAQASLAGQEGRNEESIRLHDQAIALAQANGLDREVAKAYGAKAGTLDDLDRDSEAMDYLIKTQEILGRLDEDRLMADTLDEMGNVLTREGASPEQLRRAVEYHTRALQLLDPTSDQYGMSSIYYNLGLTYFQLKDYPEALKYLDKCLAVGKRIKDAQTVAYVNYRLGAIELARGNPAVAVIRFDAALPGFEDNENLAMEFLAQLGRAQALAAQRRRKESLATLAAAEALVKKLGAPHRDAQYHEAAAQVHASLGEWQSAFEETIALRQAEREVAKLSNRRIAEEMQNRFGTRLHETENQLLRAQTNTQEAQRLVLIMALALSALVALALVGYLVRQTRQSRRFAMLAMRDDLTGLPNRRSILEFTKLQFRGQRAQDGGFVVALIDIDHFKLINDELGHSVGDEVLKAFAHACMKALRSEDRLGRFGGEEFVVTMPGSQIAQVPVVFERLRQSVALLRAAGFPEGRAITFSMGATASRDSDPDLDSIIKRADDALYRAKKLGRNRFEVG